MDSSMPKRYELDELEIDKVSGRMDLYKPFDSCWPEFINQDTTGFLFYDNFERLWPDLSLLAVDRATGEAVARAHAVPLFFEGDISKGLPEEGWDWAIRTAIHDHINGVKPNIVAALEITVLPKHQGRGVSTIMLSALRNAAAKSGVQHLVVPVRPVGAKSDTAFDEYVNKVRSDNLPIDPWLRSHVRAGATILNIAHNSMTISGTLEQWREWTGMPFDQTGQIDVPGGLTPVHCEVTQGTAVYVEPNVWVHHRLD